MDTATSGEGNRPEQGAGVSAEHGYYEVGGELLAKPQALGDVLHAAGLPPTLVFCNSPSDTDLVEVLLKKRGIGASKLIGYVPQGKLNRALERIASREISVLVLTDIAARGLKVEDFSLVVNYSVPADIETYQSRAGGMGANARRVASIISPLDIANFHFLKKGLGFEVAKWDLPGQDQLLGFKVNNLASQATEKAAKLDEETKRFASLVLSHADKEAIVSFLLHNTFEVIPQLTSQVEKANLDMEFPGEDDDDYAQPGATPRGRGGRPQREQRERRGRGRRSDSYEAQDDEGDYEQRAPEPREERRERQPREREERDYERDREPRVREDRLYIGHGSLDGFSEDQLAALLTERCGLDRAVIKRFSIRPRYAFADLPAESSSQAIDGLTGATLPSGQELFVKRATTLVAPREQTEQTSEADDTRPAEPAME